jgi:hypothetical protein
MILILSREAVLQKSSTASSNRFRNMLELAKYGSFVSGHSLDDELVVMPQSLLN